MRFSNTSRRRRANPYAVGAVILCVALAGCGTKPKNLKTESNFPGHYPPEDVLPVPPVKTTIDPTTPPAQ